MKNLLLLLLVFCFAGFGSCNKDGVIAPGEVQIFFSSDTLFFDTVFTSRGSITQSLKIINPENKEIKINSINLAGGAASPFKININGSPDFKLNNEIIGPNDSIYLFVQVMVDPDNRQHPFIVEDSIGVSINEKSKWIQLRAYGQNAFFIRNKQVERDTTWNDSLPIVITGNLTVGEGVKLTIAKGANIFLDAASSFIVNGTLEIKGSPETPVIFTGARTDAEYKELPASWPGIFFSSSSQKNMLKGTVIKNAQKGIVVQGMSSTGESKVKLSQSIIQNIYDEGILAIHSSVSAENSLIANCGTNLALLQGGRHSFINCTIASYGNIYIFHENPVLVASTDFEKDGNNFTSDMDAQFTNCIFWGDNGSVKNEILLEKTTPGVFDVLFDHCIYKAEDEIDNASFIAGFKNEPPLFDSVNTTMNVYDFHFLKHPESPVIKNGAVTSLLYDLDGKQRGSPPDIGCYER